MKWKTVKKTLDNFLDTLVAVSMVVLTIDVTWQVITRFILNNPSDWTEELATNLMIWVGLLGAAVALNHKAHLGIDYFVGRLPLKKQIYTETFGYLAVALFSVFVMFFGGLQLVTMTFRLGQVSPSLGVPMGYVYLAIPVAGVFLTIYSDEFFIETFVKIKHAARKPNAPDIDVK